jgi:hypothetical protein
MQVTLRAALLIVLACSTAHAADRATIARARALYNEGRYSDAIEVASLIRTSPADKSEAELIIGRAHLEEFRAMSNPLDLDAAREALRAVDVSALSAGDETELLIGLAEALFLEEAYGAAAELFEPLLDRTVEGELTSRERLLDWWANAIDRQAQRRPAAERPALYTRVLQRMEQELGQPPDSATAVYWAVVGARLTGEPERAWDLAVSGWVRAPLAGDRAATLRADLDRLVNDALIPERARHLAAGDSAQAIEALQLEWTRLTERWP